MPPNNLPPVNRPTSPVTHTSYRNELRQMTDAELAAEEARKKLAVIDREYVRRSSDARWDDQFAMPQDPASTADGACGSRPRNCS